MVALNPWQAVILGLTQGLTEFLPVSSSAHLVFVPELLGIPKPPLLFDVLLHLATGLAVVLYFRRDLTGLIIDGYKGQGEARKLLFWLVLASLPAVILALAFSDLVKAAFGSPIYPAFLLLVTAAMLFSADYAKGQKEMAGLGAVGAFLVGDFPGLCPAARRLPFRFDHYRRVLVGALAAGGGQVFLSDVHPNYYWGWNLRSQAAFYRRSAGGFRRCLSLGDDSGVYQRLFCYPLFPPLSWEGTFVCFWCLLYPGRVVHALPGLDLILENSGF